MGNGGKCRFIFVYCMVFDGVHDGFFLLCPSICYMTRTETKQAMGYFSLFHNMFVYIFINTYVCTCESIWHDKLDVVVSINTSIFEFICAFKNPQN